MWHYAVCRAQIRFLNAGNLQVSVMQFVRTQNRWPLAEVVRAVVVWLGACGLPVGMRVTRIPGSTS